MATTLVLTDIFNRANSIAGSPGNNWSDPDSYWSISNNLLTCGPDASGAPPGHWILRPASETNQNQSAVYYFNAAQGDTFAFLIRANPAGHTAYYGNLGFQSGSQLMSIQTVNNTTFTTIGPAQAFSPPTFALHAYIIIFEAFSTDTTHTNVKLKLYDATNIASPLQTVTATGDTFSACQNMAGQVGIRAQTPGGSSKSYFTRFDDWNYDGTNDPTLTQSGVNVPTPAVATTSATTVSLSVSAASGGIAPYTYQWQKSTTATGTFVNVGVAGQTLTDSSLPNNTLNYYRCQVTDSTSGTALVGTSRLIGASTLSNSTSYSIGFVGDSTTANTPHDTDNYLGLGDINLCLFNEGQAICRFLSMTGGLRPVTCTNQAFGGAKTADWAPATLGLSPASYKLSPFNNTGTNSNVGSSYLLTAIRAFLVANVSHVSLALGINDCQPAFNVSATTYSNNMQGVCNALVGNGFKVIVHYPSWIQDGADALWTTAALALYQSYLAKLDALVDNINILAGDRLLFRYFANNTILQIGSPSGAPLNLGVHDNQDGVYHRAFLRAQAISNILSPLSGAIIGG